MMVIIHHSDGNITRNRGPNTQTESPSPSPLAALLLMLGYTHQPARYVACAIHYVALNLFMLHTKIGLMYSTKQPPPPPAIHHHTAQAISHSVELIFDIIQQRNATQCHSCCQTMIVYIYILLLYIPHSVHIH